MKVAAEKVLRGQLKRNGGAHRVGPGLNQDAGRQEHEMDVVCVYLNPKSLLLAGLSA